MKFETKCGQRYYVILCDTLLVMCKTIVKPLCIKMVRNMESEVKLMYILPPISIYFFLHRRKLHEMGNKINLYILFFSMTTIPII